MAIGLKELGFEFPSVVDENEHHILAMKDGQVWSSGYHQEVWAWADHYDSMMRDATWLPQQQTEPDPLLWEELSKARFEITLNECPYRELHQNGDGSYLYMTSMGERPSPLGVDIEHEEW